MSPSIWVKNQSVNLNEGYYSITCGGVIAKFHHYTGYPGHISLCVFPEKSVQYCELCIPYLPYIFLEKSVHYDPDHTVENDIQSIPWSMVVVGLGQWFVVDASALRI